MEKILETYAPQARKIRENYRHFSDGLAKSDVYTDTAKVDMQKELKQKYGAQMDTVKTEYLNAIESYKQGLVKRAFAPSASASQSEYLTAQNQADGMTVEQRMKAAQNALDIGATDHARAIARSAYNCNDGATLRIISENAGAAISLPLQKLMTPEENPLEQLLKLHEFTL